MREALPTTHPAVESATWTQVSTLPGKSNNIQVRYAIHIRNEDDSNNWRFFLGSAAPSGATAGQLLKPGDVWRESGDNTTVGHVYAYQASGGTLETLAVTEYRNK